MSLVTSGFLFLSFLGGREDSSGLLSLNCFVLMENMGSIVKSKSVGLLENRGALAYGQVSEVRDRIVHLTFSISYAHFPISVMPLVDMDS